MTKETLIDSLNEDLSGEYQAIMMYVTYAASVTGPHRPVLRQFFLAEVPEELAHAQFLADKITSLGGQPVTEPRSVPVTTNPREMLAPRPTSNALRKPRVPQSRPLRSLALGAFQYPHPHNQ